MARRWTGNDDQLFVELYDSGLSREVIAERLGRSGGAIDARRRLLARPPRTQPPRRWTEAEDAFLRAASAARVPSGEVARRLKRTPSAIRRRRELLGVTRPPAVPYRPEEDALIAGAVAAGSLAELAAQLERSEGALRLRAKTLGLVKAPRRRRWAADEDGQLRAAYADGLSIRQIMERLDERSTGAIVARAQLLGLAQHGRRWTAAEDTELAALASLDLSAATQIAQQLGRTAEAIGQRCRLLALPSPAPEPPRRRRWWTRSDDEFLTDHAHEPVARLAAALGRSPAAVRRRRHGLGLAKPQRTQHHPLDSTPSPWAQARAISGELPLTPGRALAVARRLELPLAEIRRVAREHAGRNELRTAGFSRAR